MNERDFEASVRDCYSTWGTTYYDEYYGANAPYPPVHRDLLKRLISESGADSLLDAGCGPASFLRELTDTELELHGFDLTPEMVEEGQRVLGERGEVWEGSVLDPADFRGPYDAAVCIGVLPHIPAEADERVLANLHAAVRPGGLAVVEARNQLFALFTLNRYTYELYRDELVGPEHESELEPLKELVRMDLPPIRGGKEDEPGYDEVLSRTHNPFVLADQMGTAGFRDVRPLFYHFHALPPMLQPSVEASLALEDPDDWRGHFMASAFLLAGIRE